MPQQSLWKISIAACLLLPSLVFSDQNTVVELSEVSVTGEKISRTLQETTTAVSVVGEETINNLAANSIYEAASLVPNMVSNPAEIPAIRGVSGAGASIGGFAISTGARARISTTIDGISEGWNGQRYMDIGAWDVEQIEVLRGAQSTSQGRNSIGGAVIVNTKDPTFYTEGAVRLGYENEEDKALVGVMVSGPVIEDELALRLAAQGTYGHSFIHYKGTSTPWDPSEIKQTNVRGKMLWTPKDIDGLRVKVTASHRKNKGGYMNEITDPDYVFTVGTPSNLVRYTDSRSSALSTDVEYEINPELTLSVLAGVSDSETTFEQAPSAMNMDLDERSATAEMRLHYTPFEGLISGMAGLHWYNRKQDLVITEMSAMAGDDKISTVALFGEGAYHATDKLDVIFGGRIEREHQRRDVRIVAGGHVDADVAETIFLPKVGLQYTLTPEHTLGINARKGYTPGGGSFMWDTYEYYEFDKEEVWTYEATTRSVMLGKTLALNTNLFYSEYDGYQGILGAGLGQRFVNIGKSKSYGFEAEMTYLATSTLQLHGGFGLLRTKITQPDKNNFATKGNELNHAPHFTGNIGFKQYLSSGIFFGSDLNYVGEYYTGINNNKNYKAGKYTLVNLQAGYETKDYTIRAYVKNAFDEEVLYSYRGTFQQVGQPRTFGVTFDYRF